MASKPILTTGVALAGAAAIVAATPAIMPTAAQKTYVATASASAEAAPRQLTVADYELMAVTLPGLLHAFFNGHGALVSGKGDGDCSERGASCPTGPLGALYYLGEETVLAGLAVDNFFFEHGPYTAAAYVAEVAGASEDVVQFIEEPWNKVRATFVDAVNAVTGGTEDAYSLPAILVHEFIHNGGPLRMVQIVVELIKEVFDPTPLPDAGEDEEAPTSESAVSSLLGDIASPKLDGSGVARLVSLSVDRGGQVAAVEPQAEDPEGVELTGAKAPSLLPENGETAGLGDVVKGLKAADEQVEATAPEDKAPEIKAPETTAPEIKAPEIKAPEAEALETEIDETDAGDIEQGQVGDTGDVDPKAALTDSVEETASDETKSRAELRREAAEERIQERREAAKERAQERREAVKERVNDARSKVRDAVKRATGGSDSDARKSDSKDSAE
ncbi:hypothetical protein [[Mycobacterium] wendilense]|uniref:PE-PGRS family protein n=1 Tax=[Mycobacterium] wendilense TaxID=3064284 RepID=A0ABN9NZ64_9MYCO|nr:hypothetical protein [Mycolicibacterium sp. MU0050]CAJ1580200.1 hypothetical protein MU0050_000895 [Mycolicibacterium sp. MU0050]